MGDLPVNTMLYGLAFAGRSGTDTRCGPCFGIFVLLVLCTFHRVIYFTDAKTVTLDVNTRTYPVNIEIPRSGWPGVSNVAFAVSGKHANVIMAAWPWELDSETARNKRVENLDQAGWIPGISSDQRYQQYFVYNDFIIIPHNTIKMSFAHSPAFDDFSFGLARESAIWETFPHGATFCEHTQMLYFVPHKLESCLGDHIATLSCTSSGPLTCRSSNNDQSSVDVVLNGNKIKKGIYDVSLAPFDYRIEMGEALWPACRKLLSTYYFDKASINIGPFQSSGLNITMSGRDLVPPTLRGESRLTRYLLYCNETYMEDTEITFGLLRTGVSFFYNPTQNTVEIHETRRNTMKNTWEDVIVLNVCIFCLMHFFADKDKNIYDRITLGPELLGIFAALAGLALQNTKDGVYYRVQDYHHGSTAASFLSLLVVLLVCAHLSCLGLLFSQKSIMRVDANYKTTNIKMSGLVKKLRINCETLRRMSAEISLLGSIFLQVASGSMVMWDSYVTFLVGLVMVYNASYRCSEIWIGSLEHYHRKGQLHNNHPIIALLALIALGIDAWVFYTISALPATDPISGLAEHAVEVGSLAVTVAVSFGLIGLASNYITERGAKILRDLVQKKLI